MEVMLSEVERLLGATQRRDWLCCNHAQLIYDFTNPDAPEFRLMCTAPNELDLGLRQKLSSLDLHGFRVPTKAELDHRSVLDLFLSQALEVPLQTRDDGSTMLQCIDDHGFILTLDFTMKLLSIHERVACRVPCIPEGETGVSKTALTKMYSILRNSSLDQKVRARTIGDLKEIEDQLKTEGFALAESLVTIKERLHRAIIDGADGVGQRIFQWIQAKAQDRSPLFASLPCVSYDPEDSQEALDALEFFCSSVLEKTFYEINVDASLTENDFIRIFEEVRSTADRLVGSDATIFVFLDGK